MLCPLHDKCLHNKVINLFECHVKILIFPDIQTRSSGDETQINNNIETPLSPNNFAPICIHNVYIQLGHTMINTLQEVKKMKNIIYSIRELMILALMLYVGTMLLGALT